MRSTFLFFPVSRQTYLYDRYRTPVVIFVLQGHLSSNQLFVFWWFLFLCDRLLVSEGGKLKALKKLFGTP
jgi:hypothetical protein